jgi:4-carboxymuconolactone decarboxylase
VSLRLGHHNVRLTGDALHIVLLRVPINCGVPAAVDTFRTARETFAEIDGRD